MDEQKIKGPGNILKRAREKAGMSTKDVARALRLSELFIDSMDSDNYEHGPGPAYVKGYLRSYSRLVEVSEDKVIKLYEQSDNFARAESQVSEVYPSYTVTESTSPVKVILTTAILVAAIIWAYSHFTKKPELAVASTKTRKLEATGENTPQEPDAPIIADANTKTIEEPKALVASTEVESASNAIDDSEFDITKLTPAHKIEATQATASLVKKPAAAEPAKIINKKQEQPVQIATISRDFVEPADSVSKKPEIEKVATVADMVNSGHPIVERPVEFPGLLEIEFSEDCWVSISDATDKKLLVGLMESGKTVSVRGKEPIKVVLGNAWGAHLKYNGDDVDTSNFEPNQVGRIVLGDRDSSIL